MSAPSLAQLERQHLLDPSNCQIIDQLYQHSERVAWTFEGQTMGAWIAQCRNPSRLLRWRAAQSLQKIGTRAVPGLLAALDQSEDPGPYLPLCLISLKNSEFVWELVRRTDSAPFKRVCASLCAISMSQVPVREKIKALGQVADPQLFFEVRRAFLELGAEADEARELFEERAIQDFEPLPPRPGVAPSLAQQFEESWEGLLMFYDDWRAESWFCPLQRLLSQLRILGYDRVLRAGQSLTYAMFSRSRRHGMSPDDDWVSIDAKENGTMAIQAQGSDRHPILIPKIALCDELITRLESLSEQGLH